jgi:5S rRNA maturation endonuclease (ribonuclease M5)
MTGLRPASSFPSGYGERRHAVDDQFNPQDLLEELSSPPEGATKAWFQKRGQQLEVLIKRVLELDGLEPSIRIRPSGEEIDGSFALDGHYYLLEAKWRAGPTPASDLYAFKGKVDGKLTGTIGVFITMGRYSPDAVPALQAGKALNLILFSSEDFRLVVDCGCSFTEAMRRKLRHATEHGSPFLPLLPIDKGTLPAGSTKAPPTPPGVTEFQTKSHQPIATAQEWDLIVEGRADQEGITALFNRLVASRPIQLRYWVAEGAANVPSVASELTSLGPPDHIAVFIDADEVGRKAANELEELGVSVILMRPDMECWITPATPTDWYNSVPPTSIRAKELRRLARNADVDQLRESNPEFDALLRKMGIPRRGAQC